MMEAAESDQRRQMALRHIEAHRKSVEEEAGRLREELVLLGRREVELREELGTLDAILAAIPEPRKESEAPSLFAPAPQPPVQAPAPAEAPKRRRRRKGSRREQLLPRIREKFGAGTFGAEDVTDVVIETEGGERRKAYFAAWSLTRDLAEDSVIEVVAEEGTGPRKKRTYRFAGCA